MEQYLEKQLHCLCRSVRAADERAVDAAKRHWNGIAKPLYGLGRFEDLLTKVAGIQNTENIKMDRKAGAFGPAMCRRILRGQRCGG